MNKPAMPESSSWNNYWSLDQTKKFTKVSWSKRRIISILAPFVRDGKNALDAGCGSGFFSKYFCDQGMKTVSLDYSDEALALADKMTGGRAKRVKKDLLNVRLSDELTERFDIIFTDGLFEHFSDQQQDVIFKNLTSVLSETGVIVTFVPNRWSPWELIRPLYMPGIEETPFTLKQLIHLNQRNSINVKMQGGINTLPFALSPDKIFGSIFGMLLFTIGQK